MQCKHPCSIRFPGYAQLPYIPSHTASTPSVSVMYVGDVTVTATRQGCIPTVILCTRRRPRLVSQATTQSPLTPSSRQSIETKGNTDMLSAETRIAVLIRLRASSKRGRKILQRTKMAYGTWLHVRAMAITAFHQHKHVSVIGMRVAHAKRFFSPTNIPHSSRFLRECPRYFAPFCN